MNAPTEPYVYRIGIKIKIMKRLAPVLLLSLLPLFLAHCGNDDVSGPGGSGFDNGDSLITISGITRTSIYQEIISADPDDWCFSKTMPKPPPDQYALYPAYPNPSYQQTVIEYALPAQTDVQLVVIDSTSKIIRRLVDAVQEAGYYTVSWDGKDDGGAALDTGLYRVVMSAGSFSCYGDVQKIRPLKSGNDSIAVFADRIDTTLSVSYDSPTQIGSLLLLFTFSSTAGEPTYSSTVGNMVVVDTTINDIFSILIAPSFPPKYMPAGQQLICTIPVSGTMQLNYADASDTGLIVETIVRNSP